MAKVIKMADGGRYYPLDKDGKERVFSSDKPEPKGGSRYYENTPSFESLAAGNAGQGIRGDKIYVRGQEEYSLPATKKPPVKKASGGSVSARADGIAQRGKTKGRMC